MAGMINVPHWLMITWPPAGGCLGEVVELSGECFCALCKDCSVIQMLVSLPAESWVQTRLWHCYSYGYVISCKHFFLHHLIGLIKSWMANSWGRRGNAGLPGRDRTLGDRYGKTCQPDAEEVTGVSTEPCGGTEPDGWVCLDDVIESLSSEGQAFITVKGLPVISGSWSVRDCPVINGAPRWVPNIIWISWMAFSWIMT